MDSKYPLLKVHASGTFTTNILGGASIEHNLGYIPFALVFSQYADWQDGALVLSDDYYQHDWEQAGATVTFFGTTKIYSDTLSISIGNSNEVRPGEIDGFYYIFKDEV